MTELYDRQQEMGIYIPNKVTVIGLGGGGSWVAINLALMGVKELVICDNDFVEESNLNRTLFRYSDINKLKTEAVELLIKERRPDCRVTSFKNTSIKLYEDYKAGLSLDFCSLLDSTIIIDATDNYQTRTLLHKIFSNEKFNLYIHYCKLGYDGTEFEIDWTFTPIEDSNLQGYRRINTYVGTVLNEVATLIAQIGSLPTVLTNGHYKTDIVKHYRGIFTEDMVYGNVTRPLHYEGFKLIPFPEDMLSDLDNLIGKRCYVESLSNTKDTLGLTNYMVRCLNKDITISSITYSNTYKRYIIKSDKYNWISNDLLLITDEQYDEQYLEPTEEVKEETLMDYLIENVN